MTQSLADVLRAARLAGKLHTHVPLQAADVVRAQSQSEPMPARSCDDCIPGHDCDAAETRDHLSYRKPFTIHRIGKAVNREREMATVDALEIGAMELARFAKRIVQDANERQPVRTITRRLIALGLGHRNAIVTARAMVLLVSKNW